VAKMEKVSELNNIWPRGGGTYTSCQWTVHLFWNHVVLESRGALIDRDNKNNVRWICL
jgi:hypothetical protein